MLALALVLVLITAACGGDGGTPAEDPTAGGEPTTAASETPATEDLGLQQDGTIVVGSDIAFAPFEFVEDGENKGFDIDLMTEIADRLGLEAEFVNASFDTIFTQLASGDFDAIISGITITPEREEQIAFSDPYFFASQAITVGADADIAGEEDLEGKTLAVQSGTTGEDYAQENYAGDAEILPFPTSEAAFTALTAGQVDAVFIDLPVAEEAAEGGDLEVVATVDTNEEYGIGVQKDNTALVEAINTQLEAIISDGTYEEIYGRWFTTEVPEAFSAS